jgi:hypothetical protein
MGNGQIDSLYRIPIDSWKIDGTLAHKSFNALVARGRDLISPEQRLGSIHPGLG